MTKTILFIFQHQKHEILRDKFNKNVQDLYTENYKILLSDIFKELNKWRDIQAYLGYIADSVPDHHNKAKCHTKASHMNIFGFSVHIKLGLHYTVVYSV